jgi:hypothetical protein
MARKPGLVPSRSYRCGTNDAHYIPAPAENAGQDNGQAQEPVRHQAIDYQRSRTRTECVIK